MFQYSTAKSCAFEALINKVELIEMKIAQWHQNIGLTV